MSPLRLLLVGIDGADPGAVRGLIDRGRLPALARLARSGRLVSARSTEPPATYPAWTTALTGVNPGRHGVFDFAVPAGYGVRFGAPRPAVPTWLETLGGAGLRVGAVGFPGRLHRPGLTGFHLAGWEFPLQTAAGRRHVHPPELHDLIRRALGPRALDTAPVDETAARDGAWRRRLGPRLAEAMRARTALTLFLARQRPVDLLAVHYQAVDTAGHHAWPEAALPPGELPPALVEVYQAADEALAALRDGLEPEAVLVVSDHGMGPTSDGLVSVNALLRRAGLQRADRSPAGEAGALLRRGLPAVVPAPLRDLAFRLAGSWGPSLLESHARLAGIDLPRSAAFSDEMTYFPSVRLNVRGREPRGLVAPADRRRVAEEAAAALRGARRPDGAPIFARVALREELFDGPFVERAPDLLLAPAEEADGRTPSLCPPHLRRAVGPDGWGRLAASERSGRKGGVLRGAHRPFGILGADPDPIPGRPDAPADLLDVAPWVHALLGLPDPPGIERPRRGAPAPPPAHPDPGTADPDGLTAEDRRSLERRLRGLGYID